ncbi:MAG: ABC transporter ATP-binding protein [Deltaproteobacteria bacterium]|nr:ABC transporter ATP-binding protein [Deltaproteobacteria bacterium]
MNRSENPILKLEDVWVRYGTAPVVQGVSLEIYPGETVSVVGSNGAGKSTLLKAIMGARAAYSGRIIFEGNQIQKKRTEEIVTTGIIYVPEDRRLFRPLSVEENLFLGAYALDDEERKQKNLEFVYDLFPVLHSRRFQATATMSGGEQQMVAIGRGLMSNPRLLMLDEPSLGLAPMLVDEVLDTVRKLRERGLTILLVEQNVREALEISDRGYILQTGRIAKHGSAKDLLESDEIRKAFLGM